MSLKTFREVNNYIYISMIILAALSINNPNFINLFSFSIIGYGVNCILCSYYKLTKFTSFKISRLSLGIFGIILVISGGMWLLFEIYSLFLKLI